MTYLPEFLAIAGLHLLAVISPGPDFAMIARTSIVHSRKTALIAALGLALGISLHVTYSLVGIGVIIAQSIILFSLLKILGAGYLLYIGWKSLRAKPYNATDEEVTDVQKDLTAWQALRMGFLTNALNPKATIFFVAVFLQVINPETPIGIKMVYGMEMSTMTFLWFSCVALFFSHPVLKRGIRSIQHHIERVTGAVLILFGLKLAFSKMKD